MDEINIEDMNCCGNCSNHNVNDGGTLQCSYEEHISDYNHATCPFGVCDKWEFDEIKDRTDYIEGN